MKKRIVPNEKLKPQTLRRVDTQIMCPWPKTWA